MNTQKKICPQCGAENNPDAMFCMNCGAPLGGTQPAPFSAQPAPKKAIPKLAIILPVCIFVVGIALFAFFYFRSSAPDTLTRGEEKAESASITTPFSEYIALVGGDYKTLYSNAYSINEIVPAYYTATTTISFMDISGAGSFYFCHAETEETQTFLSESGLTNDTVLSFIWTCSASTYSLDAVAASFESIYGPSTLHGTYPLSSAENDASVESYYWQSTESGYGLELYHPSDSMTITASWFVVPESNTGYETVATTLTTAFEEKDLSTYESLLYTGDDIVASSSLASSFASLFTDTTLDRIELRISESIPVHSLMSNYLFSGQYSISSTSLERIENLYIANADLLVYQGESMANALSCQLDIAYIDGGWKILGFFPSERFSDTLLIEFAKQYYASAHGAVPPYAEVDHYEGDAVVIHLYEINDNTTATWDWYTINPYTLEGTDFLGQEIRLYEIFSGQG